MEKSPIYMKTVKYAFQILFLVAIVKLMAGCFGAADHHVDFQAGYSMPRDARVEVGSVTNDTGETFDFDISGELRTQLQEELERQHLTSTVGTSPNLIIHARIMDYEKGSAAARWVMPGLGGTRLMIRADLVTPSGEKVGTASVVRSVETGGFYSAGEWKKIFHTASEDIVNDLKSKM